MNPNQERIEALFEAARHLASRAEQAAYLERACGDDSELRRQIEAMLEAEEAADQYFRTADAPGEAVRDVALHTQSYPSEPLAEGPGTIIGRYKLLQQIGEGGFGVVYMAEQREPVMRKVALKVIKLGMDTRQVVARFEAERQALALMDHPNIAKVLDGGATETGRPYFVMELVHGIPITAYCDQHNLSTAERLRLFVPVCQAIQHAHQKGIIHRDIKPSNVLVTLHDGVPHPAVIDFGVAKAINLRLTEKTLFTDFGQMIGTPAYMSPEQAEMSKLDVDTRSDVYALGVLLYKLLTGTTPFSDQRLRSAGWAEMQRIIAEEDPPRPSTRLSALAETERVGIAVHRQTDDRKLIALVRDDLDWIVMKCLEKDRTRRYETANALATDIQRHLQHDPVLARPPSTLYRWQSFARKHRTVVATGAAFTLLLAAATVISVALAVRAIRERRQAEAAHAAERSLRWRMEETAEVLRQQKYVSDMYLAQEALQANNVVRARELLDGGRPKPGERDLRHWEWRYFWDQCGIGMRRALPRHRRGICSVAFSADGQWLAWGGEDGVAKIWDLPGGREVATFDEGSGDPAIVAFSPRSGLLAASVRRGLVKVWVAGPWTEVLRLPQESWVRSLCFSPDARFLACMGDNRTIDLWGLAPTNRLGRVSIEVLRDSYRGVMAFAPRQSWLAVGETDGRIRILDLPALTERLSFTAATEGISALAFSADGRMLASGSAFDEFSIRLWDPISGASVGRLEGHTGWVTALACSPKGFILASAAADQTIRLWNTRSWKQRAVLRGHRHEIRTIAFSPDGGTLASGSRAGEVFLWDASPGQPADPESAPDLLRDASFSPDGQTIAAWHWNGAISVRSAGAVSQARLIPELGTNNYGALFSPDGRWLATGTRSGTVRLLQTGTWLEAGQLGSTDPVRLRPVGFSGDGRVFVAIARSEPEQRCYLWDVASKTKLADWPVGPVNHCVAFSRDGRRVATGDFDGTVRLWNPATGREEKRLGAHRTEVIGVTFSPDGTLLASGSTYGDVILWDLKKLTLLAVIEDHFGAIFSLGFSPDGRRLATGGNWQRAVRLWDVSTRRILATLAAPGSTHEAVQFSPDGDGLLTLNDVGTLRYWRAPSLQAIGEEKRR